MTPSFRSRTFLAYLLPIIIAFTAYLLLRTPTSYLTRRVISTNRLTMSLSSKLSITDVELKGEKVLIRVDFNVP